MSMYISKRRIQKVLQVIEQEKIELKKKSGFWYKFRQAFKRRKK